MWPLLKSHTYTLSWFFDYCRSCLKGCHFFSFFFFSFIFFIKCRSLRFIFKSRCKIITSTWNHEIKSEYDYLYKILYTQDKVIMWILMSLMGECVSSACHQSGATCMDLTMAACWLSYFDFPSLSFETECQSNSLRKRNNQLTS